jgi:hypothetical protein
MCRDIAHFFDGGSFSRSALSHRRYHSTGAARWWGWSQSRWRWRWRRFCVSGRARRRWTQCRRSWWRRRPGCVAGAWSVGWWSASAFGSPPAYRSRADTPASRRPLLQATNWPPAQSQSHPPAWPALFVGTGSLVLVLRWPLLWRLRVVEASGHCDGEQLLVASIPPMPLLVADTDDIAHMTSRGGAVARLPLLHVPSRTGPMCPDNAPLHHVPAANRRHERREPHFAVQRPNSALTRSGVRESPA